MKKNEKNKKEEFSNQEYIEQEDGIKDPVVKRNQPIQTFEYMDDSLQSIEDARKNFHSAYKAQNRTRLIISCIGIALVIVVFVVIPNAIGDGKVALPIEFASIGVILCSLLAYSFYTRKKLTKKMKEYFKFFYQKSNEYSLNGKGFSKVEYQDPDKISIQQFTDNLMYKDIVEVGSRGLTAFEYNSVPVMICDCAGEIKTQKRIAPVFVGKYLFAASNYDDESPLIVYLKGDERTLPPTNIDGLKVVKETNKIAIYTNNKNYLKFLNKEMMSLIEEVKFNQDFVDLSISFTPGRCFVCMGYDDPLMVLPLERPYNPNPLMNFKKDLAGIMKIIEVANK